MNETERLREERQPWQIVGRNIENYKFRPSCCYTTHGPGGKIVQCNTYLKEKKPLLVKKTA